MCRHVMIDIHIKTNIHIHHINHTDKIPQLYVLLRLPFSNMSSSPNGDYFFFIKYYFSPGNAQ
jgi:hypothetical protein